MRDNVHPEGPSYSRRLPADAPVADHPKRFTCEFHERRHMVAPIRTLSPTTCCNVIRVALHAMAQLEYERKRKLRDRVGTVSRNIGNRDPLLPRRRGVDNVISSR